MGKIFTSHGIVVSAQRNLFIHRNMHDREAFRAYLQNRSDKPFVSLNDALNGKGDALTFDDATEASADGAAMAIELHHRATLFINPFNIENNLPYIFVLLNIILDEIRSDTAFFDGASHPTGSFDQKKLLRGYIKDKLANFSDYYKRLEIIEELAKTNKTSFENVPSHLKTISKERVRQLIEMGVDIQNHGWFHCNFSSLSAEQCYNSVKMSRDWINAEFGIDPRYFAVPFGDVLPPNRQITNACDVWFLLYNYLHEGFVGNKIHNRAVLKV
jgi:hypothetical protein